MTIDDPKPSHGALVPLGRVAADELEFDTIERFQSLEPGYYWTSTKEVESGVKAGVTLLLVEVIEFEDRVHSVKLRLHPRDGKGHLTMLVEDFLDAFVLCHDGEELRQREQREVLQEVSALQEELMRVQSNPQLMMEAIKDDVEAELKRVEHEEARQESWVAGTHDKRESDLRKLHRRAARRSAAKGNPLTSPRAALASDIGSVIGAGINESGVAEMRKLAVQQTAIATVQAKWLQHKTGAITKTLEKLAPYIEERSAVALARSSGAVKLSKRIQAGIASLDLYTGKGVDVFDIRDGADAPSSEPLTLIQGKRFMDEELATWADVTDEFDWTDHARFFKELASNDALLEQVLPGKRCVVSMATTAHSRQYNDAIQQVMYNIENHRVFLLVRNGGKVHAVYSGSPSHEAATRLFPTNAELGSHFTGLDGERISIRDVEFGEASKDFDNMALLYRRFLILLCGLDHRLQLFGEFYPPEQQLSFMSLGFQQRYFRFVADDEPGTLIGRGLPSLYEWLNTNNEMAQSGSRVFVLRQGSYGESAPELKRRNGLRPRDRQFAAPFVAQREGQRLYVSLETAEIYGGLNGKAAGPNVKCYLDAPERLSKSWWLCVDGVSLEEVRAYRFSRLHRHMGVDYLRLLRRLENYLEIEMVMEREARAYLLEAATTHGGMTVDAARESLNTAVRNWRASRRGAALPGLDDKAGLNEVLELMVPKGQLPGAVAQMLDAYLGKAGLKPLLVTRSGKAKLMLYVEAGAEDKAPYPDILDFRWVKRITLEPGKTKMLEGSSSLVWLGKVLPASEVEVRRYPELEAWLNEAEEPISLRRYAQVLPALEAAKVWEPVLRAGTGAGIDAELFENLFAQVQKIHRNSRGRYVADLVLALPMAVYSSDGRKARVAYVLECAEKVLCYYGNAEQSKLVSDFYVRRYSHSGRSSAQKRVSAPVSWYSCKTSLNEHGIQGHDEVRMGPPAGAAGTPPWMTHTCEHMTKRHRPGTKGDGTPRTYTHSVTLSFDRALDELAGVRPALSRRRFYKQLTKDAARERSWGWGGSLEERKAKHKAAMAKRYEHKYRSVISPLFWSAEKGRPVANALLSAPQARKKRELAAAQGGANE